MLKVFQDEEFNLKLYLDNILHEKKVQEGIQELNSEILELNKKIQEIIISKQGLLISSSSFSYTLNLTLKVQEEVLVLKKKFQNIKEKCLQKYSDLSTLGEQVQEEIYKSVIAKRIIRFFSLYKRLNINLDSSLIQEISYLQTELKEIDIVRDKNDEINQIKLQKLQNAQEIVEKGLKEGDLQDIISGFLVFYNLKVLKEEILNILSKTLKKIQETVEKGLVLQDLKKIEKGGVKRVNEPLFSDSAAKRWIHELWENVGKMTEEIYKECAKIYTLEKGLEAVGMECNQDVMGILKEELNDTIGVYFWNNFALVLEKGIRSAIKGSTFLQQTFQTEYPRLLRLFHDFLSRIAVVTGHLGTDFLKTSKSLAILKVLANFESAYLSKSLTRLLDPINSCFPEGVGGLSKISPKKEDVDKLIRVIGLELDIVKFDYHLLKMVAKHVNKALGLYLLKMEQLSSLSGSSTQLANVNVVNCLWHLKEALYSLSIDYYGSFIFDALMDQTESVAAILKNVTEQLYMSISSDLEALISKIHKDDYQKNVTISSPSKLNNQGFLRDFKGRLLGFQKEILSQVNCNDESKSWNEVLVKRIITVFVRHASIVRPLSEDGKVKLAGEITQFEFALSQFCNGIGLKLETNHTLANDYKILRSFKPLIFLETNQLVEKKQLESIPKLILLHHLFVRAFPNLSLPPWHFSWTESQYSDWLDKNESESIALLSRCCEIYAEEVKRRGEKEYCAEYPLIMHVLKLEQHV